MAEVYLARRRAGGVEKRLVIKRLRRDRHRDPRFLDLFIREAQLSMSLVQQNIVPVFDFGRIGDHVFLAMEYIDGKDLGSSLAVRRGAGLPPILAAYVAAECCQALDHAHRRKEPVIHRDVTPRNVLLSWDGEVKLADFGIAAVVGEAAGNALGTPGYMAPEQANGEPTDPRSDVYALGLVLWESLTGDHVRPAGDPVAALAIARTGELPALPEAPPALAEVLRRATARDPAERFATAREMADALDGFMVAERSREGGQPPAQRLGDWLAERWGDAREASASGELPAGAAIVTFLDDGEEGVRGTHTARSIAETAADEAPAQASPGESPARRLFPSDVHAVIPAPEPAPRSSGDLQKRIPTAPAWHTGQRRRRWVLGGLAVAAIAVVIYVVPRDRSAPTRDLRPSEAALGDAGTPPDAVSIDAAAAPPPPSDAAPAPSDASVTPADAPIIRVRPRLEPPPPRKEAGPLRPIWINALPWAYFTVDDEPKQYETPAMLTLSVGAHRVTFTNPELGVSRTVTVTVPAEGEVRHVEKMN